MASRFDRPSCPSAVLLASCLSACAAVTPAPHVLRSEPTPFDPGAHAELLALGGIDAEVECDPDRESDRLLRIARLQATLGNRRAAAAAATRLLGVLRALRALSGDGPEADAVGARIRDRVRSAAELLDAVGNGSLVLEAAAQGDEGIPDAVLSRAVRRARWLSRMSPDVWARLDPEARAHAEWLDAVAIGAATASADAIARLGDTGRRALERRLAAAEDAAAARPTAEALLSLDAWHLPARIALLVAEAPGLPDGTACAGVAVGSRDWPSVLARLLRARLDDPDSAPLALALGLHFLDDFPGEALEAVERVTESREDGPERRAARLIAALAAVSVGDLAAWESLVAREPEVADSPWVLRRLARVSPPDATSLGSGWQSWLNAPRFEPDAPVTRIRLESRRRLVERGIDEPDVLRMVAADAEAPPATRLEALRRYAEWSTTTAPVLAACIVRRMSADACLDLVRQAEWLEDGECDDTGVELLDAVIDPDEDLIETIAWCAYRDRPVIRDRIESLAVTRLRSSPGYLRARIGLALADGDAEAVADILDQDGGLLSPGLRLLARAWLLDRDDGPDASRELLRFGVPWQAVAWNLTDGGGWFAGAQPDASDSDGRAAAVLAEAGRLAQPPAPGTARALLDLADRIGGRDARLPAAHAARHARILGEADELREALDVVHRSPERDVARCVAESDPLEAAVRTAVLAGGPAGLRRLVEVGASYEVPEVRRLVPALAPAGNGPALAGWIESGRAPSISLLARAPAADDQAMSTVRPEVAARLWPHAFLHHVLSRVRDAPDAAAAVAYARRTYSALLLEIDRMWNTEAVAALALLAGNTVKAIEAADRPAGPGRSAGPLAEDHLVRLLSPLRAAIDPETLRLLLLPLFGGGPTPPEVQSEITDRARLEPSFLRLACSMIAGQDRVRESVPICAAAHRRDLDPTSALVLSWAAASGAEDLVATEGIDVDRLYAELGPGTSSALRAALGRNVALWLDTQGRTAESARMELEAEANGWYPDEGLTTFDASHVALRGEGVVYRIEGATPFETFFARAEWAAQGGRLRAAALTLRMAFLQPPDPAEGNDARRNAAYLADQIGWAAADVDAGRITPAGAARIFRLRGRELSTSSDLPVLSRLYPDAHLIRFHLLLAELRSLPPSEAVDRLEGLARDFAGPTLDHFLMLYRRETGDREAAEEIRRAGEARWPGSPLFVPWGWLPSRLRDPDAWGLTPPRWRGPDPSEEETGSAAADALEFLLPSGSESVGAIGVVRWGDAVVGVDRAPRPQRCEPLQCLRTLGPSMTRPFDAETVWEQPVDLPGGPAARRLACLDMTCFLVTVQPSGVWANVVVAAGPAGALADAWAQIRTLEDSLRSVDSVRPPATARALRALLSPTSSWATRLRLDDALGEVGVEEDCPAEHLLDVAPDDATRASLLLTAYLTATNPSVRRRALACAETLESHRAVLGVAALADPDPICRDAGIRLAAADPSEAERAARVVLAVSERDAGPAADLPQTDLPPLGRVDTLAGLPGDVRRRLVHELLVDADPVRRAVGIATVLIDRDAMDRNRLPEMVRSEPPAVAVDLLSLLATSDANARRAVRARFDGVAARPAGEERDLAVALAWWLCVAADPADRARLSNTRARLALGPDDASGGRLAPCLDARDAQGWTEPGCTAGSEPDARSCSSAVVGRLASEPLERFLGGDRWTLTRIEAPGLFLASLRLLLDRLSPASPIDRATLRMLADTLFRSERSVLLGPEGGLDASRPVECAHRIGEDTAWVCAAFVRDPVAVRAALARRAFGSPTVLRSMESLARGGSDLAVLAGLGPVLAEWTIAAFEQRGDEFETGGPQHARAMLLSECARSSWLEAGGRFEAHLSIADREGPGNDWDLELALLTGDRLVLFGSLPVARDVLARPPAHGESLAESEVFGRLAEIAPPGPASLRLIRSAPEPGTACVGASCGPMTTDFVVSDRGIDILVRASTGERTPQANDLRAYLPADAVSTFRTDAWETPIDPRDSGSLWVGPTRNPRLDPLRVALSTARRVAFAWGEIEGDPDPSGWIGAFDAGDRSAELLAAVGLPADETEEVRCGPVVCGVRRGDVVVLASHADGVAAALRRASVGTPSDADVRLGCLDGARAARLFRRLPAVSAFEGHAADFFRVMLLLVESAGAVWTDQTPGPAPGTHSRIRPPLRDVDDGSSAVGMLLVAGEIPLPRALRPDERCRGVRYRLRLPGAAYFLESDPFDPGRASATVLDEDHLEVIVVRPKEDGDQPLSPEARERHLADGFLLGTSDPSVAAQADELGAGRLSDDEYVARVVGWVHDHMVYERTVEDADAPTLLRRRRGDCSEFARLAVALLRAAGVPAVLASGFLADGGSLAPHAWIRWHDGRRWREADPTAGSVRVSAEYLPTSLLGMIGLLSSDTVVEAIEACARDGSDPDEEDACR